MSVAGDVYFHQQMQRQTDVASAALLLAQCAESLGWTTNAIGVTGSAYFLGFVVGCLVILVLGAVVVTVGSYFLYRAASPLIQDARDYVQGMSELSELDRRAQGRVEQLHGQGVDRLRIRRRAVGC